MGPDLSVFNHRSSRLHTFHMRSTSYDCEASCELTLWDKACPDLGKMGGGKRQETSRMTTQKGLRTLASL